MSDLSIVPLLNWAVKQETKINDAISFKRTPDRGIIALANEKIDPSIPNISIPESIILHPQQAKKLFQTDFQGAKDINSITKHFLNYQRSLKNQSFWHSYIDILPEGRDIGSPVYWTSEEKLSLKGTNLGSSLPEFFEEFVVEWYDSVQLIPSSFRDKCYDKNLKFYQNYKEGHFTESELFEQITTYNIEEWTSFPCYLWACMIFKSRSFPYILIDEDADLKYSMLLPVVDLLNHDPDSYVSWSCDDSTGFFTFNNNLSMILEVGNEIFNNYGKKGNEELLLGYGFVLENNKNDSVALRIKVPVENLPQIEKFGVSLPRLEDYTTSKYNLRPVQKPVDYKEYEKGLLYFCNNENLLPINLLNLFGYLVKNEIELMMSLRMRLDGLTKLRSAIELKLKTLDSAVTSISQDVNSKKALIYKEGQRNLLVKIISELKDQEKRILKDQKSKVWDLKKILKKDSLFANSLLLTFGLMDAELIEDQGLEDQVFLLWLIRCYNRSEEDTFLPKWIQTLFSELLLKVLVTKEDEDAFKELHDYFFPALSNKIPEIYSRGQWGLKELVISGKLIQVISYTRGSKDSIILVEPVAIAL